MIVRPTGTIRTLGVSALLTAASAASAAAQIVTDRPNFTESTATVPSGRMQLEAGYTLFRATDFTGHQLGEGLLRIGLIPGLELRAGIPSYNTATREVGPAEFESSGFGDASIGMKLGLYESGMSEGLPSASLLLGTSIPLGDDDFGADGLEPEAKLALGWSLAPRLDLGVNVNYTQRNPSFGDNYDEWAASVALGFPLAGRLSGFGEYYAIRPDFPGDAGDEDVVGGGITFLLSPDFQLDARVGVELDSHADAMFFGVGFAKLF